MWMAVREWSEVAKVAVPLLTLATFIMTVVLWIMGRRTARLGNQRVAVIVRSADGAWIAPYRPLRRHLTRAELLGVLGMRGRFELSRLPEIFVEGGEFERATLGLADSVVVPASAEELRHFHEG